MTYDEYNNQMQRLIAIYGEKVFNADKIELLFRKVRWRHPKIWEEAIDLTILESVNIPTVHKILECCSIAKKNNPGIEVDPYEKMRSEISEREKIPHHGQCRKCWNRGFITGYRKDISGHPAEELTCDCVSGQIACKLPEGRNLRPWLHYYDHYYVLHTDLMNTDMTKFDYIPRLPEEKRMEAMINEIFKNKKSEGA